MIAISLIIIGAIVALALVFVAISSGQRKRAGMSEASADPHKFPNQGRATGGN